MSLEKLLKDSFKLNLYEARVYLALLRGTMSPKEISSLSRVPLPRIYDTLESLQAKGFVEESEEKFSAISAKAALEGRKAQFELGFAKEQQERVAAMSELLRLLGPPQAKAAETQQDVTLLKGINAIANKFREIVSESHDVFLVIKRALEAKELFKPYLEKAGSSAHKTLRILLPKSARLTEDDRRFITRLGVKIKQADNLFLDLMVTDEDAVMIGVPDPLSEEPFHSLAVMIRNRSFAHSIRESLESIWRRS